MSDTIVRVSCVRHTYPDRTQVHLCGLDFEVERGERVVIVGPNGCGKSTLLFHILGLLEPQEGEISVFGVNPARAFAKIRERVGVLLQNVEEQIIAPTVWDDVSFSPRNYGHPPAEVDRLVAEALERVGIPHLRHKVCHHLSGGEKRKVALAGALVLHPDLLVLDEPFEGLDPASRSDLVELLNRLNREQGVTLVMATHDINVVPVMADRVYVLLRGGEIVQRGTPFDVFRDPGLLRRSNIEPPVLAELFQRLAELGAPLGSPITVEEAARILAEWGARAKRSEPRPAPAAEPELPFPGTMSDDLFGAPEDEAAGSAGSPDPHSKASLAPLADRMRPQSFDEIVGQARLFEPGAPLAVMRDGKHLASIILWGPPGTGKTTIARLVARSAGVPFVSFSAVLSGVKEVRETMQRAALDRKRMGKPTLLFVDEIHRFNRAQQDAFLAHVERGDIVLIGATTENPSFEVNSALLSRARVVVLKELGPEDLRALLERAIADPRRGPQPPVDAEPEALDAIAASADGDARRALNTLEIAAAGARPPAAGGRPRITPEDVRQALARRHLRYDRAGEEHFNLISALHKSLRDSDPHAGLYWLARMLAAGEDPLYVARRLVRFASEDVGNADPQALPLAVAAFQAYHQLGTPEGELALAQCAVYLATAPKSNAVYVGFGKAREEIERSGSLPPPLVIRNAPTGLMKDLGYGAGYRYAHDEAGGIADQAHLPDELAGTRFYEPTSQGHEAEVAKRMKEWESILAARRGPGTERKP